MSPLTTDQTETGFIAKGDHNHKLSVRDKQGAIHSFLIDPQTVAETSIGVVNGAKVELGKGERVRLVSPLKDGSKTVIFVREK